jgi:hypothetical protein
MSLESYFKALKKKDDIIHALIEFTSIKNHADYPFQDYIGINFTENEIVSLKFYFAFYEPITEKISEKFLDNQTDLNAVKHLWLPTKKRQIENTGFTFTYKLNNKFEITKGFHFRFPFSNSVNFPQTKQFKLIPEDLMNVGINFEYQGGNKYTKYYYYFHKEYNRQKFAVKYKAPFIAGASIIEYTESDKFNKIIAWDVCENNFYQTFQKENEWPIQKNINAFLNQHTGYYNKAFHGFYDNNQIRSMYYMNYKNVIHGEFPGASPINYQVFTVKDFIAKFLMQ